MSESRFLFLISDFRYPLIGGSIEHGPRQATETFMVGPKIDPYFGHRDCIPVRKRYTDGILCRSDNHPGAVCGSGVKDPRKITGRVSVMVRKAK
jgi:hypothetical protein